MSNLRNAHFSLSILGVRGRRLDQQGLSNNKEVCEMDDTTRDMFTNGLWVSFFSLLFLEKNQTTLSGVTGRRDEPRIFLCLFWDTSFWMLHFNYNHVNPFTSWLKGHCGKASLEMSHYCSLPPLSGLASQLIPEFGASTPTPLLPMQLVYPSGIFWSSQI